MEAGDTEKVSVGDGSVTVTVTVLLAEPPGPFAVNVYVVVAEGSAVVLPLRGSG
jgi:hypothetical protein